MVSFLEEELMDYNVLKKKIPEKLSNNIIFQTAGVKPSGKVIIGFGLAGKIDKQVAGFFHDRILLITDNNIVSLKIHQIVINSLKEKDCQVTLFSEVEPEPKLEMARKVQEMVRKKEYSLVIGLGGGSVMDMAKTASIMATNDGDIEDYMTGTPIVKEGLPNVLIPTTSGTGSEVSPFIVLSKEDKKLFIGSPYIYATIALVDPLLTVSMPEKVTAATGLDTLSHGVEGLIANTNPFTEALSYQCIKYVFRYLEKACINGLDLEARYYMSCASVLGMMSYSQGGGLYAHSLSYILTLRNGVPHGVGCGLALPYTLLFNFDYIKPVLLKMARYILQEDISNISDEERAFKTIEGFYQLLLKVKVPARLQDLAIERSEINVFASELVNKYYRDKNPRELTEHEARELLKMMWEGSLKRI